MDKSYWRESDKEWWARGSYKDPHGFDAIDFGVTKRNVNAVQEVEVHSPHVRRSARADSGESCHLPEHDLWTEFFMLTVHDALAITANAKEPCLDCRDEWVDSQAVGPLPARDQERHQPIRKMLAQRAWKSHTIQQCAINYLHSDMAREDARMLGIELDYIHKLMAEGTDKKKKWQVFNFGPIGGR